MRANLNSNRALAGLATNVLGEFDAGHQLNQQGFLRNVNRCAD
jgi:hypothetical protein